MLRVYTSVTKIVLLSQIFLLMEMLIISTDWILNAYKFSYALINTFPSDSQTHAYITECTLMK